MVFNCKVFYIDAEEEAFLAQADERKSTKNGKKKAAPDDGKKNAPKPGRGNEPKVAVKPVEKPVQPSSIGAGTKRADDHPGIAAISPTPPSLANIPPATKSATSTKPPIPAVAVNPPVNWREIRVVEEQLPGRSPEVLLPSKVNDVPVRKADDDDDKNRMLLNNLDSGHQKLKHNDLEGTANLVLKMRLHCEGCVHKVRRAVKKFEGVKAVAFDMGSDLVKVKGNVDKEKLVSYLKQKLNQEIEVVLPARPNNAEEAPAINDRKDITGQKSKVSADDNSRRKAKEGAASQKLGRLTFPESIKVPEKGNSRSNASAGAGGGRESGKDMQDTPSFNEITSTLNLRIELHCDLCIEKIRVAITQFKGVDLVDFHIDDDLVTVIGKVDVRELISYLKSRLKHNVEVAPTRESAALVDEKHRHEPPLAHLIDREKNEFIKEKDVNEVPVKRATPVTTQPIYVKDTGEKLSGNRGTDDELPPLMDCMSGTAARHKRSSYDVYFYHRLDQNRLVDMFSDENPNAYCSIM